MEINHIGLESDNEEALDSDGSGFLSNSSYVSRPERISDDQVESNLMGPTFHVQKWKRLRRFYTDQYLDLFNSTIDVEGNPENIQNLLPSQIGVVTWTSEEKNQLFQALARYGRHDLRQHSEYIGTKSQVEVKAYLNTVHSAFVERQLFISRTKNLSLAEIPAAIEVGQECEAVLDKAADALNAYQEQFDMAAGQNGEGSAWLITRDMAMSLDAKYDNEESDGDTSALAEASEDPDHLPSQPDDRPPDLRHFFKLSTLLDLSEKFFMNPSSKRLHSHWRNIAERGQRPSLTLDTIHTLLELVTEKVRQIVKTSIRVAISRHSATSTIWNTAAANVSCSDVATALDVLAMPSDSWDFWKQMARRNQLRVISGSHNEGESRYQTLSYRRAEAFLTPRPVKRRRRSTTIESEASSGLSALELSDYASEVDTIDDSSPHESGDVADSDSSTGTSTGEGRQSPQDGSPTDPVRSDEHENEVPETFKRTVSRQERQLLLGDALEEYMEKIDQEARQQEESRLWQILGKRPISEIEDTKPIIGQRPKTLRKTLEELSPWSCEYMAEWEIYGNAKQVDDDSHTKRPTPEDV